MGIASVAIQPQLCLHDQVTVVVHLTRQCNLACSYCYVFQGHNNHDLAALTMSQAMAVVVCEQFLSLPVQRIDFNWHGGEPTLCDPSILRAALEQQQRILANRDVKVSNKLQTNGLSLSDEWVALIKEYPIDVGISLDGPGFLHDAHRKQVDGSSSFPQVLETMRRLKAEGIHFGILMVITQDAAEYAEEVFDFVVGEGLDVDLLPCFCRDPVTARLTSPTIKPSSLTRFLKTFFDRWISHPSPPLCRMLEDIVGSLIGITPCTCSFRNKCDSFFSVDEKGGVYACDLFFGDPRFRYGNLEETGLLDILSSNRACSIYQSVNSPASKCVTCNIRDICGGGCTGQRVSSGPNDALYYYCSTRKAFIKYVRDFLKSNPSLFDAARALAKT